MNATAKAAASQLAAFQSVDFNPTRQLKSVWRESPYEVAAIHAQTTREILDYFDRETEDIEPDNEPRGCVVLGPAGHGKTHLMGRLRHAVWARAGWFVLLDLVGVKDFWSSVALGFVNSLQVKLPDGQTQYNRLILVLAELLGIKGKAGDIVGARGQAAGERMPELAKLFRDALARRYRAEIINHRDVVTALILLASDDLDQQSIAHAWLQGMSLDPQELRALGFIGVSDPMSVVKGLSWLMSLVGPTLIAVDQIDAIVSAANIETAAVSGGQEVTEAVAVVEQLAQGLMDLHEVKRRAVVVISCLEATWAVIKQRFTAAVTARFQAPLELQPIPDSSRAASLVEMRLAAAYAAVHFKPPYATWPFRGEAFDEVVGLSPRELLQKCEQHRLTCMRNGRVSELTSFGGSKPPVEPVPVSSDLDGLYAEAYAAANVADLFAPEREDELRELFADALQFFSRQLTMPEDVDCALQADPDQKRPSLHGRLTFTFRAKGDREEHYCFRVLTHINGPAYLSRIKAAMTASGIGRGLAGRHLFLLRTGAPPSGPKSQQLTAEFLSAGGRFIAPVEADLRAFAALRSLAGKPHFSDWLRQRKPLFETPLFQAAGLCPPPFLPRETPPTHRTETLDPPMDGQGAGPGTGQTLPTDIGGTGTGPRVWGRDQDEGQGAGRVNGGQGISSTRQGISSTRQGMPSTRQGIPSTRQGNGEDEPVALSDEILIGHRISYQGPGEPVGLKPALLNRHVAIFAGSGSGKTVLLRRLVEEAALAGIPSIVLDINNDLARLGDPWPTIPDAFSPEDAAKAERYQSRAEVVVWTPGLARGNPLVLNLLPDFAAIGDGRDAESEDERAQAVDMALSTLEPYTIGRGQKANERRGVLADALRLFARQGGGSLRDLVGLLGELPDGCTEISQAEKHGRAMADQLLSAIATNPLLRSEGQQLDPQLLFHGRDPRRTRISVINLSGLPSESAREAFVNQLQMTLFTWLKQHPSPTGRLYVLDEAQNFAPSQTATACRASTRSLAAQARKYGLGMVFATQLPRGLDNGIVSNCTTHFYGRMSSSATLAATRELMDAKGGAADDLGKLEKGMFYFSTEGFPRPVKIRTPLCLSFHPANPPGVDEVVRRAQASARVGAGDADRAPREEVAATQET
ncbi:ATP-binding protein [Xanthobacter variabilis]|uniref:ATP-binding protein n=1 Tax=Xanthobacter variabilis TaxID=3119932 RepID=UPI00374E7924